MFYIAASYHHFIMSGYDNPYIKKVGLCTYCRENPLTLAQNQMTSTPPEDTILDHILVRGIHVSFTQVNDKTAMLIGWDCLSRTQNCY